MPKESQITTKQLREWKQLRKAFLAKYGLTYRDIRKFRRPRRNLEDIYIHGLEPAELL